MYRYFSDIGNIYKVGHKYLNGHKVATNLSTTVLPTSGQLVNTLRTGSFKLFKCPFPGFLTILTL